MLNLKYFGVVLCAIVLLPHGILSLSCYICADNNLDEFGECSTPFQYDCSNYEKRYPNEKVFCRTTRHRSVNGHYYLQPINQNIKANLICLGTYTIVKECIAESVHYSTFPPKNYKLDEECDVIDVNGLEVAYCLCRNTPSATNQLLLTNLQPLKTFIIIFCFSTIKSTPASTPLFTTSKTTLVEGNVDSRGRRPSPFVVESSEKGQLQEEEELEEGDIDGESQLKLAAEAELAGVVRTTERPINEWKMPSGNLAAPVFNQPALTQSPFGIAASTRNPFTSEAHQISTPNSPATTAKTASTAAAAALTCMQCSQVGLSDSSHFGVEKMCVPEKAVLEEFGEDAVLEGCRTIDSGSILSHYCVCSKPQCNRASVMEQMTFEKAYNGNTDIPLPAIQSTTVATSNSNLAKPTQQSGFIRQELGEIMSCAVCLDSEPKDAMTDCAKQNLVKCDQQGSNRMYCLTRQSQNGKGTPDY
uniref:Sodefrin-like factor n=1 Tax=Ditylenchus dipsaci TaxID=166011 RepID=A0A915DVR4_9BILA